MLCAKNSKITTSTSKQKDFGKRSTLFRRSFISDWLGECWNAENVSFCQNNRTWALWHNLIMFISKFTSCNGLKYHKIRYKSRGNNPIKPFQFQFTCVQPVFLLVTPFVNKLWLLEMYLLNWGCQRRRQLYCFYRSNALWWDDERWEIRRNR